MITLKRFYAASFVLLLIALFVVPIASAQNPPAVRLPRPSQKASVMQTIGVTDVTITYSRPGVKGRVIWGDPLTEQAGIKGEATLDDSTIRPKGAPIVPWGHAWRTGANEATQFVVTDDVLINGQKLPAGSYSLHTVPTKNEWTIIFNSVANQWGSFSYDPAKDTLRVKAKPEWVGENKEWLEYSIDPVTPNSAQVNIRWEKIRVPFTVEVPNVEAVWRGKVDAAIAANPTDEKVALAVAGAYAGEDNFTEALKWVDQSIKVKETFQNLATKAQILFNSGKKDEAFIVAEQALARGKADKVDTTRFEKRLAAMKAGKM
ncbi:MAG: hypothetical protein QOD33_1656 [Pyrinomonadaceae bacterium]|jgi:hypothetical protein|nr:hypothetical protein [Pyrinomonadaceae bacterium]